MIPFQLLEQRTIQAALDFANLGNISSVEVVIDIFMPAAGITGAAYFRTIPPEAIDAFANDRLELTEWLKKLASWKKQGPGERIRIHDAIQQRLAGTIEGRAFWQLREGRLEAYVQPVLTGVQACYAFAAALLLDKDAKRWERLHQCALAECGKWFWEPTVRAGPVRRFCTDQHATKFRKLKLARKHK